MSVEAPAARRIRRREANEISVSFHFAVWSIPLVVVGALFGQCGDCPTELRCRNFDLAAWCQSSGASQCDLPPQPDHCQDGGCGFVEIEESETMTAQLGSLDLNATPVIVTRWSLASPAQVVLELDGQVLNCETGWTAGELRCPLPLSPPPSELRLTVLPAPAGFPPGPYQPAISLSEEKCTQEVEVCGL